MIEIEMDPKKKVILNKTFQNSSFGSIPSNPYFRLNKAVFHVLGIP
jgi:hypothetical protein